MTASHDWGSSAGTASISSSAPTPADIAAVSRRLTRRQNETVQERSVADARAFGGTASWSARKRDSYLRQIERNLERMERAEPKET